MPKALIFILKILFSVGLTVTLLYLVFKNVDWVDFWQKAKSVDYSWVIASIILSIVAYIARAYRWNILLEPLGYNLKTSRTTLAILVGYLANIALPRLGEIARCGILNRNHKVPMSTALGSVVSERVFDVLTLLVLILVSLMIEYEKLITFFSTIYKNLNIPSYLIITLFILGFLGVAAVVFYLKRKNPLKGKFQKLVKDFLDGIFSLKKINRPIGFFVSTVIIWVVYFLVSYIIVFSLPETSHLEIGAGFMLLVTGGIAISLPVQSGFGTYHGMIATVLMLYSVEEITGIFLATLLHTSQILSVILFGTIALIISFSDNLRSTK